MQELGRVTTCNFHQWVYFKTAKGPASPAFMNEQKQKWEENTIGLCLMIIFKIPLAERESATLGTPILMLGMRWILQLEPQFWAPDKNEKRERDQHTSGPQTNRKEI